MSEDYFNTTRTDRKLMIFHNANFQFYLENTTSNNFNQPAEYRLGVKVQSQSPVVSNSIIGSHNTLYGKYNTFAMYDGISTSKRLLDDASIEQTNTSIIELDTASNVNKVGVGTEIFDNTGASKGKVTAINYSNGTLTMDATQGLANDGYTAYYSQPKEALYMESIIKVGCTFHINGTVQLFINGDLIKEGLITVADFNFGTTDCYIGQDPDTANTQFMGELHEISMYKSPKPTISSTTLSPGYNDILFYYRFGE
jgi:hypothetical protein